MIKKLLAKLGILKKEESTEERTIELMLISAMCINSKKLILGDPVEDLPRKYLDEDSRRYSLENQNLKLSDLDQLEEQANINMDNRIADIIEHHSCAEGDWLTEEFINEIRSAPGKVPVWFVKDTQLCLFQYAPCWIYNEAKKYFSSHGNRMELPRASVEVSTTEEGTCTYSINMKY